MGVVMPMYDITTGTGDFIANGVISHNCFARPTHAYLNLNPLGDFEKRVVVKTNVAEVLRRELAKPSWKGERVAMGTNTDPYQRCEGRYSLMPGVITNLAESRTPFSILTKGTLITRDLELLAEAATQVPVTAAMTIGIDRKSTRLNSSHANISYAVFCLKKKTKTSMPMAKLKLVDGSGPMQATTA